MIIRHEVTGEEIARHTILLEKGRLIKNTNHGRDWEKALQKYRTAMIKLFEEEKSAVLFVDNIMGKYKRYARDQLMVLEKSVQTYPEEREAALDYCIKNGLWSANDFRDVAAYLSRQHLGDMPKEIKSSSSAVSSGIQVATRSITDYIKFLGGEVNE